MSLIQIVPPAATPVSVSDLMLQLGMIPASQTDVGDFQTNQLQPHLDTATSDVEGHCKRSLMLQTWQWLGAGFPRGSQTYRHHRCEIALPKPPLLAVDSVRYLDQTGAWVDLPQFVAGQSSPPAGAYGYRVIRGGDNASFVVPAGLMSWPATQWPHAESVCIQYRAGYGGNLSLTVQPDGLTTSGYVFAQGDVGAALTFAATDDQSALVIGIQAVDGSGNATLANAAPVGLAIVFYGRQLPAAITGAIKFLAQFFYEQDVVSPTDWPPFLVRLLNRHRNLIS